MIRRVYIIAIFSTAFFTACDDESTTEKKEPSVCECMEKAYEDDELAKECEKMYENASVERQLEIKEEAEECMNKMSK